MRQKKGMFLMPRRFSLKTRLLSLLLSAAMVLMFLPASAFAADDEQVRVGDTWLGSAMRVVPCGDGTAAYDPDTKTLTLTNVTINYDDTTAIFNKTDGLTIKLVGKNSINSGKQTGILSMQGCGLLTLTGEGSLTITTADGQAIYANTGSLLIKDTTVTASSGASDTCAVSADYGIEISGSTLESTIASGNAISTGDRYGTRGDLKIENSNVTTSNDNTNHNGYPAIWCDGDMTINGGQLKSTCIDGNAISASGYLKIENSNVTTSSDNTNNNGCPAIRCKGDITINGGQLKSTCKGSNAIYALGDLKIENSNVTTDTDNDNAAVRKYPAIWSDGDITINGGQLKSTCTGSDALGASGTLSITNCNMENKGASALYSQGEMTLTDGSITAEAEYNAIISDSAMTITNATVKATAQKYNALRASDFMKIDGGRVEATTTTVLYDDAEPYAIHMQPMGDGSNDGRMEIGGGVELYVKGYKGISVGEGATIEDAHIVIDSEDCSIDMPVKFADGYDIARALGGDSKENAKPFDWYSMSLEPFTPNQPGTYRYLELLSGAKHTLRVTNGMISEMNGKPYTGNEAEIPAGSPVTLTLTVNEDAFTAGEVFSSWTLSPTPRDLQIDGNVITFTMPAEDVEIRATGDIPPEPTPDEDGNPMFGLALGAVAGTLVGLTFYAAHELGITQTLRETLPAGAAIPANRGELALLLWNAADKPEPENQPAFTDVSDPETAKAAQWAIEAGLMETESSGKFAPAKRVTRLKVFRTWKAANH